MKILVTGVAGFIGCFTAKKLLDMGYEVVGIDNLCDYYDVSLKEARLKLLEPYPNFIFLRMDISDKNQVAGFFNGHRPDIVINLAAQPGIRYGITHPHSYINSNIVGFLNILEGCRAIGVKHLVYASSSSVYGANTKMPFSESDPVDHPLCLYAATKKAGEMMAHSYAHLFGFPTTGLRFFTVYGPWGRPDMALFKFAKKIMNGEPIDVYNNGNMERDFTYIDDIVEAVVKIALGKPPKENDKWDGENPNPATSPVAPFRIYNIGRGEPCKLMDYIHGLDKALGKKAAINMLPMQAGEVLKTWADSSELYKKTKCKPKVSIKVGINNFAAWFKEYYKLG